MRGRHEERQVVQPVAVDAPDDRAGQLADRREEDHADHLRLVDRREPGGRGDQDAPGEHAERELLRVGREVVEQRAAPRDRRSGGAEDVSPAELKLVPRRHGRELEQRPAAAGMLVGELGLRLVPDDLERAALHLVVEPRAPEHELAQPVDERLAADERDALPVALRGSGRAATPARRSGPARRARRGRSSRPRRARSPRRARASTAAATTRCSKSHVLNVKR